MNKHAFLILPLVLLATLGCGGGGGSSTTVPPGPTTLSSGTHTLSFSLAIPASQQVPVGGISLTVALPKGLIVTTTGSGTQIAASALTVGSAVTGPDVLQGTYTASNQQVSLMFATATNAVWSGEFLRLGFTVPSGSTVTANDLQGLNSSFLSVMTHAFLEHSAHAC